MVDPTEESELVSTEAEIGVFDVDSGAPVVMEIVSKVLQVTIPKQSDPFERRRYPSEWSDQGHPRIGADAGIDFSTSQPRYTWLRQQRWSRENGSKVDSRGRSTFRSSRDSRNSTEMEKHKEAQEILREAKAVAPPAVRRNLLQVKFAAGSSLAATRSRLFSNEGVGLIRQRAGDFLQMPFFDPLCSIMIIMNSVLIGYTAEFNSQLVRAQSFDERQEPMPVVILGHICTVFFFLELVLRMVNMGAKTQRDWLVQKQLELREKYVVEMREIFRDLDEEN